MLWLTTGWLPVRGQGYNNWYFGTQAGLTFNNGGAPAPLTNSALVLYEGCAAISNASGGLQAYSNGPTTWNRNHQPMPNGSGTGGHESASQCALFLPYPGHPSQFMFSSSAPSTPT